MPGCFSQRQAHPASQLSNKVIQSNPCWVEDDECLSKAYSCKLTRLYCQIEKQTSYPSSIRPVTLGRLSQLEQVHKDTLRIVIYSCIRSFARCLASPLLKHSSSHYPCLLCFGWEGSRKRRLTFRKVLTNAFMFTATAKCLSPLSAWNFGHKYSPLVISKACSLWLNGI